MRLAYATSFDWEDICNWSGLGVYYAKMLRESGFPDLVSLNFPEKPIINRAFDFVKNQISSHLLSKTPSPVFSHKQSASYARVIEDKIIDASHILSPNTVVLGHLKKDIKKVLYTDSTLANLLNFYSNYCDLPEEAVSEAQQLEQLAIDGADLLVYSSHWAAESAIKDYNAKRSKVHILPFGANLRSIPDDQDLNSLVVKRDIGKQVNLLFIAVDWKRKGGDCAVQVTEKLNRLGIRTTLHVAGTKDIPPQVNKEIIVDHGFISKCSAKQEARLCKLIAESDFLILPSLADCTPVVFSEANAYGVPCLASDVGGHSSIIRDGINGRTWERESFVENCAHYIAGLVESKSRYYDLCLSSRDVYSTELNWKTIGIKLSKLIKSI
jgi:glycosyltransferase involved in cell wall biosynthesis